MPGDGQAGLAGLAGPYRGDFDARLDESVPLDTPFAVGISDRRDDVRCVYQSFLDAGIRCETAMWLRRDNLRVYVVL